MVSLSLSLDLYQDATLAFVRSLPFVFLKSLGGGSENAEATDRREGDRVFDPILISRRACAWCGVSLSLSFSLGIIGHFALIPNLTKIMKKHIKKRP